MSKNKIFNIKGFIDPLSLIGLGFLIVTIITGTFIVNNKEINLDFTKRASAPGCVQEGGSCVPKTYTCSGGTDGELSGCGSSNICGFGTCKAPTPQPTATSQPEDVPACKTCSGSSCIKKSGGCDPELNECESNSDCVTATATPKTPTPKPTSTPQTSTPPPQTPSPCTKEGETYNSAIPCCGTLVKITTPYGAYCGPQGSCLTGEKKCQNDGLSSFEYVCDSSGYFQRDRRCDGGCDGNSCKTGICTPGNKRCDPNNSTQLETCNSTGTAWKGEYCQYGCSSSSCKTAPTNITCGGTAVGTKVCNNAGGYNYCSASGNWYSSPCPANTTCTNGECKPPEGCTCTAGKYVGLGCGHSTGYPCSETTTVCEATSCAAKCSSQTSGFTGTCVGGFCTCSAPKLIAVGSKCNSDSECSSGYCYSGNEVLGGSPFDSVKTCHANSIATMNQTQQTIAEGTAIGSGAIILGGLGAAYLPTAGTAAYSYGTAILISSPTWVQKLVSTVGLVGGWGGVVGGSAACINNPLSDVCLAYVAGLQGDPTGLYQLAGATDDIINNYISRQLDNSFSWADNFNWGPGTKNLTDAGEEYYGSWEYYHPKELVNSSDSTNNLVKALTGADLDNSNLPAIIANDIRTINLKYNLPLVELNRENPLEYRHQLEALARENNIRILNQGETTFFDSVPYAGGVSFDHSDGFLQKTVAIKLKGDLYQENKMLAHELTHSLQEARYPSMPIEIKEYEAYLTAFTPTGFGNNATPRDISNLFNYAVSGSVNHWYQSLNLVVPTNFVFP